MARRLSPAACLQRLSIYGSCSLAAHFRMRVRGGWRRTTSERRTVSNDHPTIFALSSGRPPAAVAVVRICGPQAGRALEQLIGRFSPPRRATRARVRDPADGEIIDEALALWFPRPNSETREDMAEIQVHGGQAVIGAL